MAALACFSVSVLARQAPLGGDPEAAKVKNPVASTPESIAAGKKLFASAGCAGCHGASAEGAEKAGIIISVIEDTGGKQPPDLTDDTWDYGSTDGEIFAVVLQGTGGFMAPFKGRIPDQDVWTIINYIRSVAKK
jgi:mono/diheme cytochrome c family protein